MSHRTFELAGQFSEGMFAEDWYIPFMLMLMRVGNVAQETVEGGSEVYRCRVRARCAGQVSADKSL